MSFFEGALEDRIAIQELVASYCDAVCRLCPQDVEVLWADDGVWHHPMVGSSVGRQAIVDMCAGSMSNYRQLVFTGMMGALRVDGDVATGRTYTSELVTDLAGETRRVTGRYDDEFVKQGGQWLFKGRTFNLLHMS